MILGLRPEHLFEYHEQGRPNWFRVDLPVDVVEPMGMETMVHFFVGATSAVARVSPDTTAQPGQTLTLDADMNNMHLIDPASNKVV
jgi:multiple sugar transport system ATP-binding protein